MLSIRFPSKQERQGKYLLKMILRQNKDYAKKESRLFQFISAVFYLSVMLVLIDYVDKDNASPFIVFVFGLLSASLIQMRCCRVENSGLIEHSTNKDSLSYLLSKIEENKELIQGIKSSEIDKIIQTEKYNIKNRRIYRDEEVASISLKIIFELENIFENDEIVINERKIKERKDQIEKIVFLKELYESEVKELEDRNNELNVISYTNEMNEIKTNSQKMMLVD